MQNAWRFVADETLRERLKEAKGIGTPATRGEIIGGLKTQEFLAADGKHIVPTERGPVLHDVLQRAAPALVDPGVTAQMERFLDDVLVGRQDMMSAIDAVCDQASRIIERLTERGASDTIPATLVTSAAQRSSRRTSPPRRSGSSELKAPPRSRSEPIVGPESGSPPTAAAKLRRSTRSFAAGARKASSDLKAAALKTGASERNPNVGPAKRQVANDGGMSGNDTPLRIPFGNKEAAQVLGARYRAGGWYAPADVPLAAFRERGWL